MHNATKLTREAVKAMSHEEVNRTFHEFATAQGKHTAAYVTDIHWSDDGIDYAQGACDLMSHLLGECLDGNNDSLAELLFNADMANPNITVNSTACDGVCPELAVYFVDEPDDQPHHNN